MRAYLTPVLHAFNLEQVMQNMAMVVECGCDGVWMIGHGVEPKELTTLIERARQEFDGVWMGVNWLGLHPVDAIQRTDDLALDGVWTDNAMLDCEAALEAMSEVLVGFAGMYFGGVAFKYQEQPGDLIEEAQKARLHMDVLTTSGTATGSAPSVEKLIELKEGSDDMPIAIASGLTPENVCAYEGLLDYAMVATGVSKTFEYFDLDLLKQMREATNS